MKDISMDYDLVLGRDSRGRRWSTQLPTGIVKAGMYVRLAGGVIILADTVEHMGQVPEMIIWRSAMQVLTPAWGIGG